MDDDDDGSHRKQVQIGSFTVKQHIRLIINVFSHSIWIDV